MTSGPTREPIDPVRYISNRSSGRQGHAIAEALALFGAATTLVSGPTALADPPGVTVVPIETAVEMLAACEAALPVDVAVCVAAVGDWRVAQPSQQKLKKMAGAPAAQLPVQRKPGHPGDVEPLAGTAAAAGHRLRRRDRHASSRTPFAKRDRKGCDWIVANDVSPSAGTFGGDCNTVHPDLADGVEDWPPMSKRAGRRAAGHAHRRRTGARAMTA